MENQHRHIRGYRELSPAEIDRINEGKALAELCRKYLLDIESLNGIDKRAVELARTNLQQGFMWAARSIATPTTF